MKIAIVHYHLQPGGVTRIIEHTATALAGSNISLVVLTGQAPGSDFSAPFKVIPELQYEAKRPDTTISNLAGAMKKAVRESLGELPDIWHVHNHCLGKNTVLPAVLYQLANENQHLLLHIHDFAEDGRPANYHMMLEKMASGSKKVMSKLLYPAAEHIHYGVLNGRDYSFLCDAGVDAACLHLLPNPVQLNIKQHHPEFSSSGHLFLYPTRAIRRKNLGEFLLWAAVARKNDRFGTTMGPENPRERPRYEQWKRFAAELELPVEFELALRPGNTFEGLLGQARGLMTTSVAEGFGLAFLEPWLAGRPVCGRDLPEITDEFREEGIQLPHLYKRLDVPVQWLGRGRMLDCAAAGQEKNLAAYGRRPAMDCMDRIVAAWIKDEYVDFGRLDEEMQQQVIRHLVREPLAVTELIPESLPDPVACDEPLAVNRKILQEKYSLQKYGERLRGVYNQIADSTETKLDALDGEELLNHFLAPERLTLLRVD
jgi:glycosyltransferase involved in cell wall biosynthesis